MLVSVIGLQVASIATSTTAEAAAGPIQDRREVTADSLPTVQINGVVWKQVVVGNTVYAGGDFSKARPAGSAPGVNEVTRTNLLAYDLETGVLKDGFAPTFNAKVRALAVSPDGTKLYVGGSFTQVNGQTRNRIAAFNTATGALLPFTASFNSTVTSIVATNSAVYVGGLFSYSGSAQRLSLAALNPTSGALSSWAPKTNGYVQAMVITLDGSRLVLGGNFSTVNDVEAKGLSSITVSDGATQPFAINQVIQNTGDAQSILTLQLDAEGYVYGSAYAYGGPGPFFEGVFAADSMTGAVKWLADCHGDTYDAVRLGQAVYAVSHHHYCENIGGFPDTNPRTFWQRGNAFSAEATGTVNNNGQGGYPNFGGQPAPSLLTWFPLVPSGTFTGQTQGGWTIASTDKYLLMGGEFPSVNGTVQQGLARFAVASVAPKKVGPTLTGTSTTPSAMALTADRVRVKFPTNWDRDNYSLNYALYREGTTTPIYTTSAQSLWWNRPSLSYDDTTVQAGRTYRYRVIVSDADGNAVTSPWASVTVPTSVHPYLSQVFLDGASHYWRLGGAGSWPDYAGNMDLTSTGTVSADTAGAIAGDTNPATTFSGSNSFGSSTARETGPDTFTAEAWFKTTTTSGGKILGFGDASTGTSSNYDRHVYMNNDGRLTFGVYPWGVRTLTTGKTYNDGAWHQVVASLSPTGMRLYVDGLLVGQRADTTWAQPYAGAWRIGGDNLGGWPDQPTSLYLAGSIDDVSIYPTALSLQQIRDHYTKSGRTVAVPPAPTDALGKAVWADEPTLMWRLNDASGVALDQAGNGKDGAVTGGVTREVSSPVAPGTAYGFNGSDALVSTQSSQSGPTVYSTELWFNTVSQGGGKLIGFGSYPNGLSDSYDRHVYLEPDGRVTFGVWTGFTNTITSPTAYNDGSWHHMVATQGPSGMALYLDGVLVGTNPQTGAQDYTGYWRVGGDSPWSGNPYVPGSIDEVAVYDHALSAERVRAHYRASTAAINKAPTADFTSSCDADGACTFTSSATDVDGVVTDGTWNFGDGTASESGLNAAHTYASTDNYEVTFTATDDQGESSVPVSKTVSVTVPAANVPPVAEFTGNCVERDCTFTNSSSDPDGSITSSAWQFGDGATSTDTVPSHTFATNGTYNVTLTVTDNRGGTATVTKPVAAIGNVAPEASFTASCLDQSCTFDAEASEDSDGEIVAYDWDFGDNTTGTGVNPGQHDYAAPGPYTVRLTVTDDDGATHAVEKDITVTPPNQAPTAAFTTSVTNLRVTVDAEDSEDPDGTVSEYAWDFGDGETADSREATHTYSQAGTFTITLVVTDNDGAHSDEVSKEVTVEPAPNQKPTAAFTASTSGLQVNVDGATSDDPDGDIETYAWSFGDGGNASSVAPSHTYTSAGTYTVTLTVTDNDGATDTATKTVTVSSVVVSDNFNRTASSWGSADVGGTWTYQNASYFSTDGSAGAIRLPSAGARGTANLTGVSVRDAVVTAKIQPSTNSTGAGIQSTFVLRANGTSDYRLTVQLHGDKSVRLNWTKRVNNVATSFGDVKISGLTYATGDTLRVKVSAIGNGTTSLQAKVWKDGTSEPTNSQFTATDSAAALQTAGSFSISHYLMGTATTVPFTFRVDDLVVTAV